LQLHGYGREWQIQDAEALQHALAWRDSRGGGFFWLSLEDRKYPCMAIRVSGSIADVHYFPADGHPGFRCLGGEGLPEEGSTTLVFEGCDPRQGEETPNRFVVPFETASSVAAEFLRSQRMSPTVSWFEI
jgi:hypothetical protein